MLCHNYSRRYYACMPHIHQCRSLKKSDVAKYWCFILYIISRCSLFTWLQNCLVCTVIYLDNTFFIMKDGTMLRCMHWVCEEYKYIHIWLYDGDQTTFVPTWCYTVSFNLNQFNLSQNKFESKWHTICRNVLALLVPLSSVVSVRVGKSRISKGHATQKKTIVLEKYLTRNKVVGMRVC